MAFIFNQNDEKTALLLEETQKLSTECSTLLHDIERDEKLLALMDDDRWEKFVETVLVPELDVIAHRSMDIGVDDRDARLIAKGEYINMTYLSKSKATLETAIESNRSELDRKRIELTATNQKLRKIQE